MIPASKADAVAGLARLWGDAPETRIGTAIIDLLAENLDNSFLPLSLFLEAADRVQANQQDAVLNIVSLLTGASFQLLKLQFEYIYADDVVPLDDDAARAASEKNINPVTGEKDDELPSKLFICFTPSEVAKRALRK
ncbi:hypothetical protein [Paraburkholderia metrosideri]|uniref:Uncharacterized protein n=1 Tax=Paraburkholderia metrosideri TaxID=580937 RepID=A0ABM8NTN7_9BURK|nr:hypothetical protein [Paraburkholderia metrosideri]CAD6542931.1 hypothetical protein LMG28140_03840 [Paraburkholderia metrosideri]